MSSNESFFLSGPVGRLEAILMSPSTPPRAAAVVCHAHPLHGGMMHFKLVFRIAKALQSEGVVALRFNFRGVGLSEGTHDNGHGEQQDVAAAIDELSKRYPDLPLLCGGFSFGSVMSLLAGCPDPRVRALFILGVPLSHLPQTDFITACTKPRLFIQGAEDALGKAAALESLSHTWPAGYQFLSIPDSDHFFSTQLDRVQSEISAWIRTEPWRQDIDQS